MTWIIQVIHQYFFVSLICLWMMQHFCSTKPCQWVSFVTLPCDISLHVWEPLRRLCNIRDGPLEKWREGGYFFHVCNFFQVVNYVWNFCMDILQFCFETFLLHVFYFLPFMLVCIFSAPPPLTFLMVRPLDRGEWQNRRRSIQSVRCSALTNSATESSCRALTTSSNCQRAHSCIWRSSSSSSL